ncbi:MAG: oxidoreductase, partial [Caldilinea sp.]|nr:oxidoreductase [Caldilinea sp.]
AFAPDDLDDPASYDLVYEVSGAPAALNTALALAGYAGRVVIGSWYGAKQAPIDLGGAFHRSRIRLLSSQVSTLDPRWLGRWDKARRLDVAWAMLRDLRAERVITHTLPVSDAPAAYRLLSEHPEQAVQVLFDYTDVH